MTKLILVSLIAVVGATVLHVSQDDAAAQDAASAEKPLRAGPLSAAELGVAEA